MTRRLFLVLATLALLVLPIAGTLVDGPEPLRRTVQLDSEIWVDGGSRVRTY